MCRFRVLLMIGVTLLDAAFMAQCLKAAEPPAYIQELRKGTAGDNAALDQGLNDSEAALTADPKDAQAQVWHGIGLMLKCRNVVASGDNDEAVQLFGQALKEMDAAVAEAPDDPRILLPRGSTVLHASIAMPPGEEADELLRSGLDNYLKCVGKVQGVLLDRVLYGIADAYARLGQTEQATKYFERVAAEAKGTGYERNARVWLTTKSLTPEQSMCDACDAKD